MKFQLKDDYIELFKLIKVLDLVDSGAQAKMLVADGYCHPIANLHIPVSHK